MAGAEEQTTVTLEERVAGLPSMGNVFGDEQDPESFILKHFGAYSPRFLTGRRVKFKCHCNRERLRSLITLLPVNELKDILKTGPFPLEMRCKYCNATYLFSEQAIRKIYGKRYPHN
jgi:molecular chaperone Hsp33